ncbi:MAG TPA: hypothetical protein RMH85_35125 [Polyangiaceae bacterium LLY-WYZ-15_(1-7)]|nr:hypothetical protein [Sandaracinus sp.]HJL06558.1 hypothetical protein [Polyangiaceae bacterium LLY-WYZ-15_(1-7)]HJL13772.1 hypothetical protein [Polyangiaceae bacterium LLY-WYZ-15_(1-7)]HJL32409.1 hypothetical protein [Polyangiaceae bacterium LLY-WYZ-15_(1-7)]HJL35599.1 hypothetical protein [Polyangiaceae bacterium LLY-WYZ-15_(1-7)]
MRPLATTTAALALAACGSAPSRPCPLPTPESERAAFFERLEARRADATGAAVPVLEADLGEGLARPTTYLRVRVGERGIGVREGHVPSSLTRAELDVELSHADPMRLGWLLSRDDVDALVPLDSHGRVPAEERMGGPEGYLIEALHAALEERIRLGDLPRELGLEIRPSTPFRTVAEIVYTAGQAGVERLQIVVRVGDVERAHALALPGFRVASMQEMLEAAEVEVEPLSLSLALTSDGAIVSGSGGRLAPGCEQITSGSEPTLPAPGGAVDVYELRRCLRGIHELFPHEDTITITADPEVAFEHVARAAVAAAGQDRGLFPNTQLSAGIR